VHTYKDIAPELPPHVIKFIFGDVPSCLGLDLRSRQIATIAAVAILGTAHPELKFHIQSALNVGLIREATIEVILQLSAFAGVPAAIIGRLRRDAV
jgi:4-carboxymuconolactone decarboxylase